MKKVYLNALLLLLFLAGILFSMLSFKTVVVICFAILFAGIILLKYETITYILAFYPFVDYIFRNYVTALASIWDELLLLGMGFIWLYKYFLYKREEGAKISPIDLPIIIFISTMVFVFILNSPDYKISLEGFRAVVQYILWYFVVIRLLKNERSAKLVCLVFVLMVSLLALHGIYQYIIGVEVPSTWTDMNEKGVRTRVFSILTSPNILGSLMALAIPICLSFIFVFKKYRHKIIFAILALCMCLTLLFTFSRGAWIAFAAAIFIYIFIKDKRFFIPVIILGILVMFFVPGVFDRIIYMLSSEYIESSLKGGRLVRWINGLTILSSSPILGVGLGHFGGAVAINHGLSYDLGLQSYTAYYMDNYYLKTAVETGIVGFLAFAMLMYQVFLNGLRTINITTKKEIKELEIGIISGLFGIMIHNFVENVFEVPMMTSCFWLLVAVLMHLWYINYKERTAILTI